MLRVDDGKGRHAYLGMGFRDRDDAYNFNATLQDHWCAYSSSIAILLRNYGSRMYSVYYGSSIAIF